MEVRCQRCGLYQDPFMPQCVHLRNSLAGTMAKLRLGVEHYRRAANKRHAPRLKREEEADDYPFRGYRK